jgi:osmotically-inducible protein OsmY
LQTLRARLHSDIRTCGQCIDVVVGDDYVELVGTCDSEELCAAAIMIVMGTAGVRDVENKMVVRRLSVMV